MQSATDRASWLKSALREHQGPLLRFALSKVGDVNTAQDIVQETFVRLCAVDQKQVEGHLAAWLFTVCRNLAHDVHRREGRMQSTDVAGPNEAAAPPQTSPSAQIEAQQTASHVVAAIDGLPDKEREVIRLKFSGGLSYKEIAEVTGHSVSYVGVLVHGGMKKLRAKLATEARPNLVKAGGAA